MQIIRPPQEAIVIQGDSDTEMKRFLKIILVFSVLCINLYGYSYQHGYIGDARYLKVYFETDRNLRQIIESGLIIDRLVHKEGWLTCYAVDEHIKLFDRVGAVYEPVPTTAELYRDTAYKDSRRGYRTFTDVENELTAIASDYPLFTELITIGYSVQSRPLYFLRVTSNIESNPVKPEFHYISTMHGNEKVGTEMCMEFIYHLLDNYGTDQYVTDLLDDIDFYIMPVMNPDGFVANTRNNANGYDLNRNFPDFITDPEDTPAGKQVETAALMQFYAERRGILSANFHTGALVVNYPWDSTYTIHPENDMLIELSLLYSIHNPPMYASSSFPNGITNGAQWYIVHNGMQDYSCYYHSNLQVTVELSDSFQPPSSTLPQLWIENRDSMLYYSGAMRRGVQGYVLDAVTHEPVPASISVNGINWVFDNDPESGLFHKMLLPGTYTITVSADTYLDTVINSAVIGSDWNETLMLGNVYMDMDTSDYISLNHYVIDDSGYNNDGVLNPGETVSLTVNINNNSYSDAVGLTALISSENPYITIIQDYSAYPDIAPQGSADNTTPFTVSASPDCPHDEIASIRFDWSYGRFQGVFYIDMEVKSPNVIEIGEGTTELSNAPLYVYYHDNRTQVIYTAEELGNMPFDISSLSFYVSKIPEQTLNNWTIRMKHTVKDDYESSASFEDTGWTVVYQNNEDIGQTGWREFVFIEVFEYNGLDNLMVDFSFNNSSYVSLDKSGRCFWTPSAVRRAIYAYSDSNHGDPLNWSASYSPSVSSSTNYLNIILKGQPHEPLRKDSAVVSFNEGFRHIYTWEYGEGWTRLLENEYALKMLAGDITGNGQRELVAYFPEYGLYYFVYASNIWYNITAGSGTVDDFVLADADSDIKGKDRIIASVQGIGLSAWEYESGAGIWSDIISERASILYAIDVDRDGRQEIAVSFQNYEGIYIYSFDQNTFNNIMTVRPSHLSSVDHNNDGFRELIVCFLGYGIYRVDFSGLEPVQWVRLLYVAPHPDYDITHGNITGGDAEELICTIGNKSYYYSFETSGWTRLVDAPFNRIKSGRWTQSEYDDLLLSSSEYNFIFLYKSLEGSFERLLEGIYSESVSER